MRNFNLKIGKGPENRPMNTEEPKDTSSYAISEFHSLTKKAIDLNDLRVIKAIKDEIAKIETEFEIGVYREWIAENPEKSNYLDYLRQLLIWPDLQKSIGAGRVSSTGRQRSNEK